MIIEITGEAAVMTDTIVIEVIRYFILHHNGQQVSHNFLYITTMASLDNDMLYLVSSHS